MSNGYINHRICHKINRNRWRGIYKSPNLGYSRARTISRYHFSSYEKFLGGIIIYDITKRSSYNNVISWLKILKSQCEKDGVIALVGNKLDLVENKPKLREVSKQEAETYAFLNHLLFFETSAYYQNSYKIFEDLLQTIYNEKRKILYRSDILEDNSGDGINKSRNINYEKKIRNCYNLSYENSQEDVGCKCNIFWIIIIMIKWKKDIYNL